jgi:predicted ABC-type ATPase
MSPEDSDQAAPRLVVIAGPNGSGKSTITDLHRQLQDLPPAYVNADEIAKKLGIDAYQAAALADTQRKDLLEHRTPFAFETVLSHPSKLAVLSKAHQAGYDITLVYVGTEDPKINLQRVASRVLSGGHDVPGNKTVARWHRSMELLAPAVQRADASLIYDNSGTKPFVAAQLEGVRLAARAKDMPKWVEEALLVPLAARVQDLKKIDGFAKANGLELQHADPDGGRDEGRMLAQTKNYITQMAGEGTLIVHDKAFVGTSLAPGRALIIDYKSYHPETHTIVARSMNPSVARGKGGQER